MKKSDLEALRFPIGRHKTPGDYNKTSYEKWIHDIKVMPEKMATAIKGLNEEQLDTLYRPDGWTIRQVVHHVADSHMNAYIRMKLAITEENPTIKPYNQDLWANTDDSLNGDIQISMEIITALHKRWALFLESLGESDFDRCFYHPDAKQNQAIKFWLSVYSWHCRHHVGHIVNLRSRKGW